MARAPVQFNGDAETPKSTSVLNGTFPSKPLKNNLSPNRSKRRDVSLKAAAIRQELAQMDTRRRVTLNDVCWMARCGELLPPSPTAIDAKEVSSWLYGPSMKTVQLERIEVIEYDEDGREVWRA